MPVNVGRNIFPITLYYRSTDTVSDMGSKNPSFTTYSVMGDFEEITDTQRIRLGMNIDESVYTVKCVAPTTGRVIKIAYNSTYYRVISCKLDMFNKFLELLVVGQG